MKFLLALSIFLGLFLFGCIANAPVQKAIELPSLDCATMQRSIEQNCNVELVSQPRPGYLCYYLSKDEEYSYYFGALPLDKYYTGVNDLKKVLDSEGQKYEVLTMENGAIYLNKSSVSSSPRTDLGLYVFDNQNQYILETISMLGHDDNDHCVSKTGLIRISGFRKLNGTIYGNPYNMQK